MCSSTESATFSNNRKYLSDNVAESLMKYRDKFENRKLSKNYLEFVSLAGRAISKCLDKGLRAEHIIALHHLFRIEKMYDYNNSTWRVLKSIADGVDIPFGIDGIFKMIGIKHYIIDEITLDKNDVENIRILLQYVVSNPTDTAGIKNRCETYLSGETENKFCTYMITQFLNILNPSVLPIVASNRVELEKYFKYELTYSQIIDFYQEFMALTGYSLTEQVNKLIGDISTWEWNDHPLDWNDYLDYPDIIEYMNERKEQIMRDIL